MPFIKSWFDVPMTIFLLFGSAGVLFDGAFHLWESLSVVKNNWNRNFYDFIDLQEKWQVWQILSNLTKVTAFIPAIIYSWQLSTKKSLVDNKDSSVHLSDFTHFFYADKTFFPFPSTNVYLLWRRRKDCGEV